MQHMRARLHQVRFLDHAYWQPSYDERKPVEYLAGIAAIDADLKLELQSNPQVGDDMRGALMCDFLQDVLVTEGAAAADAVALLVDQAVIERVSDGTMSHDEFLQQCSTTVPVTALSGDGSKLYFKLRNLARAASYVRDLPGDVPLSCSLACTVHGIVMERLCCAQDSGRLRCANVMPAGTSTTRYACHTHIEQRLCALLSFTDAEVRSCGTLEGAMRLGSFFLSEFLLIHPFANGNGRVGRLLLQLIAQRFVMLPFGMCLHPRGRELYISALEDRGTGLPCSTLATLLLHCVHKSAWNMKHGFL